jgi:acid phosphatase type 7
VFADFPPPSPPLLPRKRHSGYGFQFIWDEFGRQIAPVTSSVPFQTCVGNHESPFNFSAYKHRYGAVPHAASKSDTMLWYSHNMANTHWVYFSTEHPYGKGSPQYEWLKNDLEEANKPENRKLRPWIFVVGHRPAYCSNTYVSCGKDSLGIRDRIEDLLYANNVDVAWFGHVHAYERTYPGSFFVFCFCFFAQLLCVHSLSFFPPSSLTSSRGAVYKSVVAGTYDQPKATTYMLVGMAGAACCGDDWRDPKPDWSAYRYSEDWGYTRLEITDDNHMCLYLHRDSDDAVHDQFCLTSNHQF